MSEPLRGGSSPWPGLAHEATLALGPGEPPARGAALAPSCPRRSSDGARGPARSPRRVTAPCRALRVGVGFALGAGADPAGLGQFRWSRGTVY